MLSQNKEAFELTNEIEKAIVDKYIVLDQQVVTALYQEFLRICRPTFPGHKQ